MELSTNQLIEYFTTSALQFVNAFTTTLGKSQIDFGRTTANGLCGFVIPISGNAQFSLNGTLYPLNQQTILHAGSSMDIEISTTEEDSSYAVIHYRILHTSKVFEHFLHQHFSISIDNSSNPLLFAQQLLKHQTKPDNFSKFQSQVLFTNLLESILIGVRNNKHNHRSHIITQALDYIHQHYAEELLICDLAHSFGLERRRFSCLFEQATGLTPIQYLTEYRITRSKELLMLSNFPISEIAEAVGYQDSFYFSRVFKKNEGISPSYYRKQVEKNPYLHDITTY